MKEGVILSNIELKYFPPNTTAGTQPLDAGIIRNFKLYYRKYFLQEIIDRSENFTKSSEEVISSIHIGQAINWLKLSWNDNVLPSTITACFRKVGFSAAETVQNNSLADEIQIEALIHDVESVLILQGRDLQIDPLMDIDVEYFPTTQPLDNVFDALFQTEDTNTIEEKEDDDEDNEVHVEESVHSLESIIEAWRIFKEGVTQRDLKEIVNQLPALDHIVTLALQSQFKQANIRKFFRNNNLMNSDNEVR